MRKFISFFTFILFSFACTAQHSITYKQNAITSGDSIVSAQIEYVSPGNAGANQIWDFSKIVFTEVTHNINFKVSGESLPKEISHFNIILAEKNNENFYNVTEEMLEYKGFTSDEISLVYTDPIIKMKYPFSFGDGFTDEFAGNAIYKNTTPIDFTGTYSLLADGTGALVMPDRTISNVIRIKAVRNVLELNPCSVVELIDTIYYWYADDFRYPVLTISRNEVRNSAQEPKVAYNAFCNYMQNNFYDESAASASLFLNADNNDIAILTFPNPFEQELGYSYFLRTNTNVSIALYDITGKLIANCVNNQNQLQGLYSGKINTEKYSVVAGVYYMHFTFNNKVIVKKIVKI